MRVCSSCEELVVTSVHVLYPLPLSLPSSPSLCISLCLFLLTLTHSPHSLPSSSLPHFPLLISPLAARSRSQVPYTARGWLGLERVGGCEGGEC